MWITFEFLDGSIEMYNIKEANRIIIEEESIEITYDCHGWDVSFEKDMLKNFEEIKQKLMEL